MRAFPFALVLATAVSMAASAQPGTPAGAGGPPLDLAVLTVDGTVDCARRGAGLTPEELAAVHAFPQNRYAADAAARVMLARAACHGDAVASRRVGFLLERGIGTSQNDAEAVRWFRIAAEAGDTRAMSNLGAMLDRGRGVPRDSAAAIGLFRRAAEAGDAFGALNLGLAYAEGRGVARDDAEAVHRLAAAAEGGVVQAMIALGTLVGQGRGTPRDDRMAAQWYLRAFHTDPDGVRVHFERGLQFTTEAVRMEIQRALTARGLYTGPIDGAIGPPTLDALGRWTPN